MDIDALIPLSMIPIFLIMGMIALVVSKRSGARQLELARALGEALGLGLISGEDAFRAACEEAGQAGVASKYERLPGFVRRLLVAAAGWRLEGERAGLRVAVYPETRSSGKSSTVYTVARAYYRQSLGYELSIRREGALFKLGKALFGLSDLEIGDPELDPLLRIKSSEPLSAKLLVGGGEARSALLAIATRYREFYATKDFAHWEERGTKLEAEEIGAVLDLLVPLASALGG